MSRSGGTEIYCANCKGYRKCEVVSYQDAKDFTGEKESRLYRPDYPDIHWFRRVRACSLCYNYFVTAEINEDFIDEIARLRRLIDELKQKVELQQELAESAKLELYRAISTLSSVIETKVTK